MADALNIQFEADLERFARLPEAFRVGIGNALEAVAIDVEGRARANTQVALSRHATGALANSITHTTDRDALRAEVGVPSSIPYGAIHEFGGTIVPVQARVLSFVVDGNRVFASSVVIPARPYLGPAVQAAAPLLEETVTKPLREALK